MIRKRRTRKPRADFRVSVSVEDQSRLQQFYSRNLSSGGIYLEISTEPPPIGSELRISFEIPNRKRSITTDAVVIHHHNYQALDNDFRNVSRFGIGLKFLALSKDDQKLIEEFVKGKELHVRD